MQTLEDLDKFTLQPELTISAEGLTRSYCLFVPASIPIIRSIPNVCFEKCFWAFLYYHWNENGIMLNPVHNAHIYTLQFKCHQMKREIHSTRLTFVLTLELENADTSSP